VLGDGTYSDSDFPVQVDGVGGAGQLSGVASLSSDGSGECALLVSGGVDCWGDGGIGELGNGLTNDSEFPVQVEGVNGAGLLSGVASLSTDSVAADYCALLTSGGVDCWGDGEDDEQLGDGTFSNSDVPVQVEGVNGAGLLSGVASLVSDGGGFCSLLASSAVDCWGYDGSDELGSGTYTVTDVPVPVEGVNGAGLLSGVASLVNDGVEGYCALLTSGEVDCWGWGANGELGNGTTGGATSSSDVPVEVEGVNGVGTLASIG
jgi:alpha-tubulin suppressor-like RCC1 family protein